MRPLRPEACYAAVVAVLPLCCASGVDAQVRLAGGPPAEPEDLGVLTCSLFERLISLFLELAQPIFPLALHDSLLMPPASSTSSTANKGGAGGPSATVASTVTFRAATVAFRRGATRPSKARPGATTRATEGTHLFPSQSNQTPHSGALRGPAGLCGVGGTSVECAKHQDRCLVIRAPQAPRRGQSTMRCGNAGTTTRLRLPWICPVPCHPGELSARALLQHCRSQWSARAFQRGATFTHAGYRVRSPLWRSALPR